MYFQCTTQTQEEGVGSPGTGVMDSCNLLCGCQESNPGPLQEKLELVNAKPSLQPFNVYVFNAMLYATQKIVS